MKSKLFLFFSLCCCFQIGRAQILELFKNLDGQKKVTDSAIFPAYFKVPDSSIAVKLDSFWMRMEQSTNGYDSNFFITVTMDRLKNSTFEMAVKYYYEYGDYFGEDRAFELRTQVAFAHLFYRGAPVFFLLRQRGEKRIFCNNVSARSYMKNLFFEHLGSLAKGHILLNGKGFKIGLPKFSRRYFLNQQ